EITQAVVTWLQQGGTAYLVTFTARHAYKDALADLMDALQGTRKTEDTPRRPGAYQRLITGGTWAGRKVSDGCRAKDQEGIRDRIGYLGMIRATEVTVGQAHGWHPHIHAIVLVGGRTTGEKAAKRITGAFTPAEDRLTEWEDHWRATWTRTLQGINPKFRPTDDCERADCPCEGKGHGVDFKRLETVQDAQQAGEYIAKTQDGKAPALELARADLKTAGGENVTPFELLGRIGDLTGGVPEDDAQGQGSLEWNLAKWHEYERATKGRRAIEWTRGLRQLLGIEGGDTEEDDLDKLFEDDEASEFRAGVRVADDGWKAMARKGLDFEATQAAEGTDGNSDAIRDRMVAVATAAGATEQTAAVWVEALSPMQVGEAYATILENQARRREESVARRRRERAR
ncbi:hypothetical protein, partial [Streptomyces sp. NPDC060022]|uniref:hypothetical protein n=1 Tax=Streptomyces sp. NPDC060022 TaxID=3347039 RepID=UPI0036B2A823